MFKGGDSSSFDRDSTAGRVVNFLFPDVFWRQDGVGGALEHYMEVHKLSPFMIMSHYFRGNVYNDWGSDYARRTQDAFGRGDIAQGRIFIQKTDELWQKSMDAYTDTRRLGPNYVQMHHQVGTVHQKWGDFYMGLAPLADRFNEKAIADEYRKNGLDHWKKALESYQRYYKIDPVFDQNYYRMAQIYVQMGQLDMAERTYLAHIEAKECRKPYHFVFGGCVNYKIGHKNNRYDLASPNHSHDRVMNAKPEAWMYLGDFYMLVKNDLPKAEECYKRAAVCTPDDTFLQPGQPHGRDTYALFPEHITFIKRLANVYARMGKNQESIDCWRRIQRIQPNDPDLQRLIQQQPNQSDSSKYMTLSDSPRRGR